MSAAEIISLAGVIITTIGVIVSAGVMVLTFFNLKELKTARFEESRAYIVVNFLRVQRNAGWRIVIKNYGHSSGVLKSVKVEPPLPTVKYGTLKIPPLTDIKDLYLAPGQTISSYFDFSTYENQTFTLEVTYETLGKSFTDKYTIDLSFRKSVLITSPSDLDTGDALKEIALNSSWFFERFL